MGVQPKNIENLEKKGASSELDFIPKRTLGREELLQAITAFESAAQDISFEEINKKALFDKRVELAKKRLEVFEARHDNTGALKGEYLGQELKTLFDTNEIRINEQGVVERDAEVEATDLLFVNLGELDRINQEGDHHTGDRALQALKDKIERTIQSELIALGDKMTSAYSIYRSGGSKFSVKLEGVGEETVKKIREQLDAHLDISSILPGKEPAPLSASSMKLAEAYEVLDQLPKEERQNVANNEHSSRIMIGTAFEMLNQLNDKRETEKRLDRLTEKIKSGNEEEARAFYEKFQARALTPMFSEQADQLLSFEEIKAKLTELGALDGGAWADKKAEIALQEARRQFEGRRRMQKETERKISEVAAKNYIQFHGAVAESGGRYVKNEQSTFTMPKPTEGKKVIEKRASLKEELEEKVAEKHCEGAKELDQDCQAYEEASLNLEYEQAIRDSMTGLKQRGPLYQALEGALENGKSVSTVYIDMAFLKYFDKEGGRDTGNLAIMKAGEILDKIAMRFKEQGKKIEAYRIGGDEFAFSVTGEDEKFLKEVLEDLLREQKRAGEVPLQGEVPIGMYADQSMYFNYGVFHANDKGSMKALLEEAGLRLEHENTEKENNELAEYMLRFADKQLEIQKAVTRLGVLLDESLATDELQSGKYAQLIKYSEKSIFGEAGKKKLEVWHKSMRALEEKRDTAKSPEEQKKWEQEYQNMRKQIDIEATEFALHQIKEKNEKSEGYEGSIDQIIEEHVRDKFLEQKIETLETKINTLRIELNTQKEKNKILSEENEELKARMELLESEKEQITTLREKIRG